MATTTVSHGSITLTRIKDGSQFWTSSAEPAIPDYTFTISNLVGDTNADIRIGDIVYYGHYKYTVTSVGSDGTTVLCGNRESLRGAEGVSPTIKSIACSHSAAICEKDGTYNPDTITFSGQSQFKESITSYEGWFVIELSSDGINWVSSYSSTGKEPYVDYKIPLGINITKNGIIYNQGSDVTSNGSIIDSAFTISSDGVITTNQGIGFIIRSIRCSLYSDANKTNLIDQQRVNIAFDGVDGDKGDDGYTVILTNENHTFSGDTRGAVESDQSTGFNVAECSVIAYIGDTQIPCTIGSITGMPVGMPTPLIYNNSTTAARFTVLVTHAMTSQNGTLNIPVTLSGGTSNEKTFNMKFTYSLKLNGLDATGLGWKVNYSSLTTPNDGECFYHGFDEATKEASADRSVHAWVLWNGQEIIIPTGCYVNPDATMPFNTPIYSVYRLPSPTAYTNGTFHDVAWVESSNTWVSNTYNGVNPSVDQNPWSWNEATDIILAIYKISGDESPITDAQLFTPPKKYSELVEPAKEMAKDAEKVATNYLAVDNTGIMVADMKDGEQTPSTATGKNVLIDSESVNIRNGQNVLSSFGDDLVVLGQLGKPRLELSSTSISSISEVGVKNFNIISGSSEKEKTITKNGTFENTSSETDKFSGSFTISDKFYYFHNIVATVNFNYTWDGQVYTTSLTLNIDDPVEDETQTAWYINEEEYSSSYSLNKEMRCAVQHNADMTFLYFDYSAQIKPKTTSVSYQIGNDALYSVVIETKTYQNTSYTFGSRVINSEHGANSFAIGEGLVASSNNQIAVGRYNDDDSEKNYAFMVGNGIYGESRSNAFAVDWNGRTEMGDISGYGLQLLENSQSEMDNYIECIDVNDDTVFSVSKTGAVNSIGRVNASSIKLQKDSATPTDYIQCQDENNNVKFNVTNNGDITTEGDITSTGDADIGGDLSVTGDINALGNINMSGLIQYNNKPMFKVVNKTFTAIGIGSGRSYTAARDIAIDGYKPMSIGGIKLTNNSSYNPSSNADASWCVIPDFWLDYSTTIDHPNVQSDSIYFYIWNMHGSSGVNVDFHARIVYIATDALGNS